MSNIAVANNHMICSATGSQAMHAPVVGLRAGDGVLPQLLAELLQLLLREARPDLRDGLELLALWVVYRQQERSKHPRPLAPACITQLNPNQ